MKAEKTLPAVILVSFLLLTALSLAQGQVPRKPSRPSEETEVECNTSSDCGKPYWRSASKAVIVNSECKNNFCKAVPYLLENYSQTTRMKVLSTAERYLKNNYGKSFYRKHFHRMNVSQRPKRTSEELGISLSEVEVRPPQTAITMKRPFWFLLKYNVSWKSDNERVTIPFELMVAPLFNITTHKLREVEVWEGRSDKFRRVEDSIISRKRAKEIAEDNGLDVSVSSFEFYKLRENEYVVPVWRNKRIELSEKETECKKYTVALAINAFSGNIERKYRENPCAVMGKEPGKGGKPMGPSVWEYMTIGLIVLLVILTGYLVKRKYA